MPRGIVRNRYALADGAPHRRQLLVGRSDGAWCFRMTVKFTAPGCSAWGWRGGGVASGENPIGYTLRGADGALVETNGPGDGMTATGSGVPGRHSEEASATSAPPPRSPLVDSLRQPLLSRSTLAFRYCALLAISFASTGCRDREQLGDPPPAPAGALTLERVPFTPDSLAMPFDQVSIAADARGGLYFLGQTVEDSWLTHLDSTGRLINRFGREGAGPGELSGGGILFATGTDSVVVVDSRRGTVVVFDRDGDFLGETPLAAPIFPLAIAEGALYAFDPMEVMRGGAPRVIRIPLGAGDRLVTTTVLDTSSSVFRSSVVQSAPAGRPPPIPAFSTVAGWTAIADGASGRVAVVGRDTAYEFVLPFESYRRGPIEEAQLRAGLTAAAEPTRGDDGKPEPVDPAIEARLDTLSRERLPFVAWPGLIVGAGGRIVTVAGRNDSTMVDVFDGSRHIAHFAVDCYQPGKRVSLNGRWLALQCAPMDRKAGQYELRLYRLNG